MSGISQQLQPRLQYMVSVYVVGAKHNSIILVKLWQRQVYDSSYKQLRMAIKKQPRQLISFESIEADSSRSDEEPASAAKQSKSYLNMAPRCVRRRSSSANNFARSISISNLLSTGMDVITEAAEETKVDVRIDGAADLQSLDPPSSESSVSDQSVRLGSTGKEQAVLNKNSMKSLVHNSRVKRRNTVQNVQTEHTMRFFSQPSSSPIRNNSFTILDRDVK